MMTAETPQSGTKKKVFVVDDHPIVRRGLRELIDQEADITVCGEAEDLTGALAKVRAAKPDVTLVDLSLRDSNGFDLIRHLRETYPKLPILVLSMHSENYYVERALAAGAGAYVTKDEDPEKVLMAIRQLLREAK